MSTDKQVGSGTYVPVSTWNHNFNMAAAACHLSAEDLLAIEDATVIGDFCWFRFGTKIQVAIGNCFWTVEEADLRGAA